MSLPQIPDLQPIDRVFSPYDFAVVIDGVVHQIMNVEPNQAAILAAQPKFVQIARGSVLEGFLYNEQTGEFTQPA